MILKDRFEDFKKNINNIFGEQDSPINEEEAERLALEEIEKVRMAFLHFQEEIADFAIQPYIFSGLEEVADTCLDLKYLIEDNVDPDKLNGVGQGYYKEMKAFRSEVLSKVYKKYNP